MLDKFRLEYEIKRKGYSVKEFCELINMSRSAFYRKCSGEAQFTLKEIKDIISALKLETPMGIFFDEKVS